MNQVKEGTIIVIDGVPYRFGPSSTEDYNGIVALVERGLDLDEFDDKLHLYTEDGKDGKLLGIREINEALSR